MPLSTILHYSYTLLPIVLTSVHVHYLETKYSNFFDRKDAASAGDPLKSSKVDNSTANDRAAAIAIAGAPRTTISLIASLFQYGILSVYDMTNNTYRTDK